MTRSSSPGDQILSCLNEPQRQAVQTSDGPVLILAGAGSGKTRAITHKISWLVSVEGFQPWEILAVTFTNKAAGEMRKRCAELLGDSSEGLWLGTFHSIGAKILRRHGELVGVPRSFVIYDQDDQKAMLKRSLDELDIASDTYPVKRFQSYINTAKRLCRDPNHRDLPRDSHLDALASKVYAHYEGRMRQAGAVDFGDLIWLPCRLMREFPLVASEYKTRWQYILVDEFQDTNKAQYMLLEAVLNDARRICVVGDDDQSIYRWRGADVGNILGFAGAFEDTTVIRLEQNYRSSAMILDLAAEVISRNATRHPKRLWTARDTGEKARLARVDTERDEAAYVAKRIGALRGRFPLREMAIFYRTNAQSRPFEDVLRRLDVPHRVVGSVRFYDRKEVRDVLAYLKFVSNPQDVVSLERILNRPPRKIGKATIDKIRFHAATEGVTAWEAIRDLARGSGAVPNKLRPFVALVEDLMDHATRATAFQVAARAIEKTSYLTWLKDSGDIEALNRAENVKELLNAIEEYGETTHDATLNAFLEEVALVSDIDQADLDSADTVVMMTAHNAKGLEFDVVFVTGVEDGLFPHFNSSETDEGIEEERRLLYVAMTRARELLHLTSASSRRSFGAPKYMPESDFISDLPPELVDPDHPRGRARSLGLAAPRPASRRDTYSQDMPAYEDMSQDEPSTIGPGVRVFHTMFGEGIVLTVSGMGPRAIVLVRFGDGREKRIGARWLTLVGDW